MRFENQTVVVTGASVGIGRAAALKFGQEGANVVIIDINEEKLLELSRELQAKNVPTLAIVGDVSDEQRMNNAAKQIVEKFGSVQVLVNNGALWRDFTGFLETPVEKWKKYIDVNVMGCVYLTRALLPQMMENKYGRIINISSVAGVYGNRNMVHYSATKGAVNSMSKALAKEVAACGITVNSICPGTVSPSENENMDYSQESQLCYMGRTGTDNENASLILFVASKEAGYISGQIIQIDGCRKIL